MKRTLRILLLALGCLLAAPGALAVTPEAELEATIDNLYAELLDTQKNSDKELENLNQSRARYWEHIRNLQKEIDKARQLMLDASKGIHGVVDHDKHYVVMRHTSCGIVRLDYKCWIDSRYYLRTEPAVREAIFHAFKENGIEIADFSRELQKTSSNMMLSNTKPTSPTP